MRLLTKDDLITIKGDRDGLHLFCQETALWSEVIAEIKERLTGEYQRFFAGASVIVELGKRNLAAEEISTLWATLLECGVQIKGIKADTGEDSKATEKKSSFVSELITIVLKTASGSIPNLFAMKRAAPKLNSWSS